MDAASGTSDALPLPEEILRAYIGGSGLGTWLLHRLGTPGTGALDAAAPLAFVFSPLVGTPLTTSAKFAVVAKSPLTGMLTDALASSQFAIAGKLTGHDALVSRRSSRRCGSCCARIASRPRWRNSAATPPGRWAIGCADAGADAVRTQAPGACPVEGHGPRR